MKRLLTLAAIPIIGLGIAACDYHMPNETLSPPSATTAVHPTMQNAPLVTPPTSDPPTTDNVIPPMALPLSYCGNSDPVFYMPNVIGDSQTSAMEAVLQITNSPEWIPAHRPIDNVVIENEPKMIQGKVRSTSPHAGSRICSDITLYVTGTAD